MFMTGRAAKKLRMPRRERGDSKEGPSVAASFPFPDVITLMSCQEKVEMVLFTIFFLGRKFVISKKALTAAGGNCA
jgi:hypothetical protein